MSANRKPSTSLFSRSTLLIVALALLGAGGGWLLGNWLQPHARMARDVGETPPIGVQRLDATLPDLDGRQQSLSKWDGRLVLLNFWASWCGPCREEMPLLDRTQQRLASRGLQVVGVAVDNRGATADFLARHGVHYPVLINDPEKMADLSIAYGNSRSVLPYTVLIGRDGKVLAQRFGNFTDSSLKAWLQPHL